MAEGAPNRAGSRAADDMLPAGERVEVRNRFDGSWSTGFEVAEALPPPETDAPGAYRVRRVADHAVLNAVFRPDDLRREPQRRAW
ncbi:MAG TPA: hypothetical protein VFB94_04935 [Acidimicrobiales bacterium]|jgi:hypothetical protein|nr:hypothetical protein [Acidimicrobiales bacterium]